MKRTIILFLILVLIFALTAPVYAYTDEEINMITNVVNGEIGGICGSITITYADGNSKSVDETTIRQIHACVVDNQTNSDIFSSSVYYCVANYWSSSYTGTSYKESSQWQSCREAVLSAPSDRNDIPTNLYAATCDSRFDSKYSAYQFWARVDWDTGWVYGTFYYYTYGDPEYPVAEPEETYKERSIRIKGIAAI